MTASVPPENNFSHSELDTFDELAQRWWGEVARLRTTGSRATERLRTDAQAGEFRHGWLEAGISR